MANSVANTRTSLGGEEAILRAVQFFTNERWRATTQSARSATFEGRPPIPWVLLFFTFLGLLFFIVPGIIMYIFVVRKVYRFQNLVVTANPINEGTEIVVTHPPRAARLVRQYTAALPPLAISAA